MASVQARVPGTPDVLALPKVTSATVPLMLTAALVGLACPGGAEAVTSLATEPAARTVLNARVAAVRGAWVHQPAALQAAPGLEPAVASPSAPGQALDVESGAAAQAADTTAQAPPWANWSNWSNWPKWSKWSNWANA